MSTKYGSAFGSSGFEGGDGSYCGRFQDSSRRVRSIGKIQFIVVPLFGAAVRRWDFQLSVPGTVL